MAGSVGEARFQPVHAGAHMHFMKVGYMHTGNKVRGGITTSEYFKAKRGNSRSVSVQNDGSYTKTSRTARGVYKRRGKLDAKGMKCHNFSPDMGSLKKHHAAERMSVRGTKQCSCGHEPWMHSKDGSCNVVGCEDKCGK
jgi:hypothetical protein